MPDNTPERYYDTTIMYRLDQIEKWKDRLEQEGIPVSFAKLDARMDAREKQIVAIEHSIETLREDVDSLKQDADNLSGLLSGWKLSITLGLGTLLIVGTFILNLYNSFG